MVTSADEMANDRMRILIWLRVLRTICLSLLLNRKNAKSDNVAKIKL